MITLAITLFCYGLSRRVSDGVNGAVVSASQIADEVGIQILKEGGNAVDAAVAVGFALAVVFPEAGNIGGGGFMLIRLPDDKSTVIDYRETAPGKASRDMFLSESGNPVANLSTVGPLAAGSTRRRCAAMN
jgi:gamma-glutamyltranspeptidase/glutathione hydrolase